MALGLAIHVCPLAKTSGAQGPSWCTPKQALTVVTTPITATIHQAYLALCIPPLSSCLVHEVHRMGDHGLARQLNNRLQAAVAAEEQGCKLYTLELRADTSTLPGCTSPFSMIGSPQKLPIHEHFIRYYTKVPSSVRTRPCG